VSALKEEKDNVLEIEPFYVANGSEIEIFEAAYLSRLPMMLQGPTGCGKTRLVEHMAHRLSVPLFTVSCHEDMTASDLLGRYLLVDGNTEWVDGPLTKAVRDGGICYLDEVVEARQDATVAIHSLTDHRRELYLERKGSEVLRASEKFSLVVSYNPGYQSVLKDLKMSTRQRMVAIELDFPSPDIEEKILLEAGVEQTNAQVLVRLGSVIRRTPLSGLREVASTRTLIAAGKLMARGLSFKDAASVAIAGPLSDDIEVRAGLTAIISAYEDPVQS